MYWILTTKYHFLPAFQGFPRVELEVIRLYHTQSSPILSVALEYIVFVSEIGMQATDRPVIKAFNDKEKSKTHWLLN